MYDLVVVPEGKPWKRFGPLYIHVSPREYILALKILASREKDLADCEILLQKSKVKTRKQAQQLLDRYVPARTQEVNIQEISLSLDILFREPWQAKTQPGAATCQRPTEPYRR